MNKKFEKRLKFPVLLLMAGLLVSIGFCLTCCNFSDIPDKYNKKEARAQEKEAGEIFAQYLKEELGGGKIEKVSIYAAVPPNDVGFYLTDFVDGRFTYEGESYAFVVNTRTEEIYTSLRLQELKETGTEYVRDYFQISCDEIIESLPGLKALNIYHMKSKAEVSEKLDGIYDYMMSEILKESVRKGSPQPVTQSGTILRKEIFICFLKPIAGNAQAGM